MTEHQTETPDVLFQKTDGTWWFWGEGYVSDHGPYPSQSVAAERFAQYMHSLLGEQEGSCEIPDPRINGN